MNLRTALSCFSVCFAVAAPSWAQLTAEPGDAEKCLVVPHQQPKYPDDAFFDNAGGSVVVEMEFAESQPEPKVRVVTSAGHSALPKAVVEYVSAYRLPCVLPGKATVLRQQFRFQPSATLQVVQS